MTFLDEGAKFPVVNMGVHHIYKSIGYCGVHNRTSLKGRFILSIERNLWLAGSGNGGGPGN